RRRLVQRLECASLAECVLAAEQQLALAADRRTQVLELEPVRVGVLELDAFHAAVPAHLDHRLVAVPWIVEEERPLAADRLQLVAVCERGTAIERREHVAWETQCAGEDPIGTRRPEPRLAPD